MGVVKRASEQDLPIFYTHVQRKNLRPIKEKVHCKYLTNNRTSIIVPKIDFDLAKLIVLMQFQILFY